MRSFALAPLRPLYLLHRPHDTLPGRQPLDVTFREHCVRPHGGLDRGVLVVFADEDVGGAVDVQVSYHGQTAMIPSFVQHAEPW